MSGGARGQDSRCCKLNAVWNKSEGVEGRGVGVEVTCLLWSLSARDLNAGGGDLRGLHCG